MFCACLEAYDLRPERTRKAHDSCASGTARPSGISRVLFAANIVCGYTVSTFVEVRTLAMTRF